MLGGALSTDDPGNGGCSSLGRVVPMSVAVIADRGFLGRRRHSIRNAFVLSHATFSVPARFAVRLLWVAGIAGLAVFVVTAAGGPGDSQQRLAQLAVRKRCTDDRLPARVGWTDGRFAARPLLMRSALPTNGMTPLPRRACSRALIR